MFLKSSLFNSVFLCGALLAASLTASAQNTTNRDYIVAIVDAAPITNHDVNARIPALRDQLKQQGRPIPQGAALLQTVLERLILEKALLQHAKEAGVSIDDDALLLMIRRYTREAGVRNLERELSTLARKAVKELMISKKKSVRITAKNLEEFLGPEMAKTRK